MTRAKSKFLWKCPKCGKTQGSDIDPKYMEPPVHRDEPAHHHNRPVVMELVDQ